jgi:hypothetical protein
MLNTFKMPLLNQAAGVAASVYNKGFVTADNVRMELVRQNALKLPRVVKIAALNKFLRIYYARVKELYF